jgi:uncharacterized protein (TIGR03435 family)
LRFEAGVDAKYDFIGFRLVRQVGTVQQLSFDAASIKPSAPDGQARGGRCMGSENAFYGANLPSPPPLGTCRYLRATLSTLLNVAYVGLRKDVSVEIKAPDWATTLEFDVLGKAPDPAHTTTDQLRQMLQAMLTERFKVRLREETRSVKGFALVAAKSGSKIKEAPAPEAGSAAAENPYFPDIQNLVSFVSRALNAPVIDQTGFTVKRGFFLVKPEGTTRFGDPLSDPSAASIFTALNDQLGFQLESRKLPVQTYVLEYAEKPTPN